MGASSQKFDIRDSLVAATYDVSSASFSFNVAAEVNKNRCLSLTVHARLTKRGEHPLLKHFYFFFTLTMMRKACNPNAAAWIILPFLKRMVLVKITLPSLTRVEVVMD